jgi:hypothetical protein
MTARNGIMALALAVSMAGVAIAPAMAADDPRANNSPPKVNKEADDLNTRNPRVFHAGPGKPLAGGVWASPSAAAAAKKPAADGK